VVDWRQMHPRSLCEAVRGHLRLEHIAFTAPLTDVPVASSYHCGGLTVRDLVNVGALCPALVSGKVLLTLPAANRGATYHGFDPQAIVDAGATLPFVDKHINALYVTHGRRYVVEWDYSERNLDLLRQCATLPLDASVKSICFEYMPIASLRFTNPVFIQGVQLLQQWLDAAPGLSAIHFARFKKGANGFHAAFSDACDYKVAGLGVMCYGERAEATQSEQESLVELSRRNLPFISEMMLFVRQRDTAALRFDVQPRRREQLAVKT
jgi:hypothetical protein